MKNKNYNSGELRVGLDSRNRAISSSFVDDTRSSSIAIIISILVLSVITCAFFAVFGDWDLAWQVGNFDPDVTTTTTKDPNSTPDPEKTYPYATTTDKTNFIAASGGDDLSDVYLFSEYAILIRLSDMTTIAHQGADTQIFPASMTKVMTVVTALDLIEDLEDEYVITKKVLNNVPSGSSTAWLRDFIGSTVTVRDLLYGISYRSGADSVVCLLDYLGFAPDMKEFASLMNEKAKEIGLQNTHFGGAIGMDEEYNQTTCRDMAAIMAYAMENPLCHDLFGKNAYRLKYIDMTYYNATLVNTLSNMGTAPSYVLGSNHTLLAAKSGLEDEAGYCLVSYVQNDSTGEKFVLVTANASRADESPYNKNPILDMKILFNRFDP